MPLAFDDVFSYFAAEDPFRFPQSAESRTQPSDVVLLASETGLATATFVLPLRSTSRVLVSGSCRVQSRSANTQEVTLRLRRGDIVDEALVQELVIRLPAVNGFDEPVTFAVVDAPATTTAMKYTTRGFYTGAGTEPLVLKDSRLYVMELPQVTKFS